MTTPTPEQPAKAEHDLPMWKAIPLCLLVWPWFVPLLCIYMAITWPHWYFFGPSWGSPECPRWPFKARHPTGTPK